MSKPDIEKLEAGVSILLEAYRQLKDENQKLTLQVEGLMREGEFFQGNRILPRGNWSALLNCKWQVRTVKKIKNKFVKRLCIFWKNLKNLI